MDGASGQAVGGQFAPQDGEEHALEIGFREPSPIVRAAGGEEETSTLAEQGIDGARFGPRGELQRVVELGDG